MRRYTIKLHFKITGLKHRKYFFILCILKLQNSMPQDVVVVKKRQGFKKISYKLKEGKPIEVH